MFYLQQTPQLKKKRSDHNNNRFKFGTSQSNKKVFISTLND